MTPQERQLLTDFLQQLSQTRADPKDSEADALIRQAIARQPDASYLLAQRAMGLELALKAAQAQTEKLQAELDQAKRGNETAFVGNAGAWGRSALAAGTAAPSPLAPPQRFDRPLVPAAVTAAAPSSWGSGMLANLATTAAGVVAGSFLYQGIEQMMGHHNAGFGGNNLAANSPAPASETSSAPAGTDDAPADDDVADAPDDDSDDSLATDDGGFDSSDLG
jgi:hypothetical protein